MSNDLNKIHSGVSRRSVLAAGAVAIPAVLRSGATLADENAGNSDFLFVQTATGFAYDPGTKRLTLTNIAPTTLFFADRPDRIAGHMTTAHFVPFWSEGTDSFLADPPNADLSIIEKDAMQQVVVTLKDPVLEAGNLHYTAEIISGEFPSTGSDVSVFIDVIGMPLTPLSFAGARRRTWRRAAYLR